MTLLAGLYSGTSAPQGKAGSATDVMSDAKRSIVMQGGCGNDVIYYKICVHVSRFGATDTTSWSTSSCTIFSSEDSLCHDVTSSLSRHVRQITTNTFPVQGVLIIIVTLASHDPLGLLE